MTKVVFMGTPDFAVPILEALIQSPEYEVVGVVTQPDRPVGRKRILTSSPVKKLALKYDLPVLQPETMNDDNIQENLQQLNPDIMITAAFGQFLPKNVLEMAEYGVVNVHASLLPKYRGGAPIHEAIIQGEKETGVTIMKTVSKMDAGDILSQRAIPILLDDNVGTVFERLSTLGRDLLLDTLPKYLHDEIMPIPQNEEEATVAPNISRDREVIDFDKTAEQVNNQVRGLNPWPVAHTMWADKRLKIFKGEIVDKQYDEMPGTVVERNKNKVIIACKSGGYQLEEVQLAGKGRMNIQEFLNGSGQKMQVGDLLR